MSEPKEFYTASEAQAVLGFTKAMFHRRVNEGVIPNVIPLGKKQRLYPKRDIDTLARAMALVFERPDHLVFSRSTIAEQEEEMHIGIRCFGAEFITPLAERIAFQQKNNYTFWSLKVDGQVVGYISTFRFPPEFLDAILVGEHIERDITLGEVLPFTRDQPFDLYIDVLAMDPYLSPHLRSFYAGVLVSRFADALLNLLGNGFRIQTLYTVTATAEGDRLVQEAGFRLMVGKSRVPGRTAYQHVLNEAGIARLRGLSRRGVYRL